MIKRGIEISFQPTLCSHMVAMVCLKCKAIQKSLLKILADFVLWTFISSSSWTNSLKSPLTPQTKIICNKSPHFLPKLLFFMT